MIEITTSIGRLVGGHPMEMHQVIDQLTNKPRMQADGVTPRMELYIGVAIAKGQETHWNQTPWGQQIYQAGVADWPNGEHGAAAFAWKVADGDSQIPNKKGKKPCDREGYPGHWVLNCSTALPLRCYHANKYDPTQQIQNKNEIKAGDYCRVVINCRGNGPCQSPGVYLNPALFELSRPGVEIILDNGPVAADAFGGGAANNGPVPGAVNNAPVAPAPDILAPAPNVENVYTINNVQYTESQLIAAKWSAAQIAAL